MPAVDGDKAERQTEGNHAGSMKDLTYFDEAVGVSDKQGNGIQLLSETKATLQGVS